MKRFVALGAVLMGGSLLAVPSAGAATVCPPGVTNPAYCQTITGPTAVTGSPVPAPPNGATLTGTVNPNGEETTTACPPGIKPPSSYCATVTEKTTYYFQYGTTTAYGQTSASGQISGGTTPQNVQETITGLTQVTTYHYRLVAKNAGGESFGADQMFTLCKNGLSPTAFCPSGPESRILIHGHATGGKSGKKLFVLVTIECTEGEGCDGVLYLEKTKGKSSRASTSAEKGVYGKASYTIAGNSSKQVKVPLNAAGVKALSTTGKLSASIINVSKAQRTFVGNISVKSKKHKKKPRHVTHATRSPGFTG
jgi:hypothetical protein